VGLLQRLTTLRYVRRSLEANLLRNGDFELGDLSYWTNDKARVVTIPDLPVGFQPYSGVYACELGYGIVSEPSFIQQIINPVLATDLKLIVMAASDSDAAGLNVVAEMEDGSGEIVTKTITSRLTWQQIVFNFTTVGKRVVKVSLTNQSNSKKVYLDDVVAYVPSPEFPWWIFGLLAGGVVLAVVGKQQGWIT
jgi:hypothetical protein